MMDIINDVKIKAKLLSNTVVMVDVSGSMTSGMTKAVPINAAIGLGLLISEV